MPKTILITGASAGIGRRTAAMLAGAGHRVFGTSRHPIQPTLDGFTLLPLDVTSDESVTDCVSQVLAQAGRIDVLINNAGIEMLGALEETSIEEAKSLFETNFFGVMRMTTAVLPGMRARRSGTIINISSLAGHIAAPFQGIYSATKHALEGYTETLWFEVEPLGIHVALIEPNFYKSEISQRKTLTARSIPDYAAPKAAMIAVWERSIEEGADPEPVARRILDIVEGRAHGLRHRLGRYSILSRFKAIGPEWVTWWQVRRDFNLD